MIHDDFPVFPAALFTGLVTRRLYASWDFYTTRLGFRTVEERNGWVRLLHPGGAQLVLLREEADGTPAELVSATNGRGLWITLEVADAAAERAAFEQAGVPLCDVPPGRWWRAGSFAVRDPDGVLVLIAPRPSGVRCGHLEPAEAAA
jgi:catechol 2,3-dioxygenase-like lactoylglutathione lyase family enzyme